MLITLSHRAAICQQYSWLVLFPWELEPTFLNIIVFMFIYSIRALIFVNGKRIYQNDSIIYFSILIISGNVLLVVYVRNILSIRVRL